MGGVLGQEEESCVIWHEEKNSRRKTAIKESLNVTSMCLTIIPDFANLPCSIIPVSSSLVVFDSTNIDAGLNVRQICFEKMGHISP